MAESTIGSNLEEIRELLNIEQPEQSLGIDYAWFVGAQISGSDCTDAFINEDRWENGYDNKYLDLVKAVKVGDKIALKSTYTKKYDLPFENNGKTVGVMAIKATGIVTENPGDGKNLKVNWIKNDTPREWYGKAILRQTIHNVKAQDGLMKKLLLQFTFGGAKQDFSLCEEQFSADLEDEGAKELIVEKEAKGYMLGDLANILSEMYNSPDCTNKVAGIIMFGIKYGGEILENDYSRDKIISEAGLSPSYIAEINKGISLYKAIRDNEYGVSFYNPQENTEGVAIPTFSKRKRTRFPLNCILYGAPGTGKTYATAEYALAIIEDRDVELGQKNENERREVMDKYNKLVQAGQIVFTTFHQSYGYEDFIQGLRPDTNANKLAFDIVDGVFKVIADKALKKPDEDFVIIIDEINRANISKVFGELITLIEEDKRWGELNQLSATLQSGDIFVVPNNLYIVGTMNSADKSISLIDAALRRRFEFVEQKPQPEVVSDLLLRKVLMTLNESLADELDSTDLLIGHSFFVNKTAEDLSTILNNSIIPLLYEYFYDNKKKVASVLAKAIENAGVMIVDDKTRRLSVKKIEE